ncbi:LAQU0S03e07448g1_1 [Lachancea quebecensis]|uniref:LAQU0S03e07448g1_1 n=1 Tax=Lachancea quebecensis TaxID=1654605 RepID=A0A0P1KPE7_9SACH|nr:LAQU0S03e07448g1_1 [Lachancea quebecensis]
MHYRSKFFEINVPPSALNIRDLPNATALLTIAYVAFTLSLWWVKWSYTSLEGNTEATHASIFSPIVQLVPTQTLYDPWSLVLSNLVDVKWWKIGVDLLNLVVGGSFIERNWNSSWELARFLLVIGSLSNLVVVLVTILSSAVFPRVRLDAPLDGNYTMLIGFCIVYKQLIPETSIFHIRNLPLVSKNFRFKLLPIFVLVISTVTQLVFLRHYSELLSIWVTFLCSWVYLRFYQVLPPAITGSTTKSLVGDASDTFQLIYFFPDIIKPLLSPLFNMCYWVFCVKLRIREPFNEDDVDTGNSLAEQRGAKKITNQVEERRRRLALQVLQERGAV